MMKSRLHKLEGFTYDNLKQNIDKVITEIPKEKYRNIIKGTYERPEKYVSKKNKTRKIKKNFNPPLRKVEPKFSTFKKGCVVLEIWRKNIAFLYNAFNSKFIFSIFSIIIKVASTEILVQNFLFIFKKEFTQFHYVSKYFRI